MHIVKGIRQIGFVVNNLDNVIDHYKQEMGKNDWIFYEFSEEDFADYPRYTHGKVIPVAAKIAKTQFENIELEFIKPMCNNSIYAEFLKDHSPGFHHLQLEVENFDDSFNFYKNRGYEVIQYGISKRGVKIAYFDTFNVLGYYLEIAVYDYENNISEAKN